MGRHKMPDDQITPSAMRQRKYRANEEHRLKGNIRSRVHNAVKKGLLTKQPCFCGEIQVEAHHVAGYDLEHALDVVWLCKPHHERLHPQPNRMKGRTYTKRVAA